MFQFILPLWITGCPNILSDHVCDRVSDHVYGLERKAGEATTGVDERSLEVKILFTTSRIQLINHIYEIKLHLLATTRVHIETSLLASHRAQQ